jgi:hypothetical protein
MGVATIVNAASSKIGMYAISSVCGHLHTPRRWSCRDLCYLQSITLACPPGVKLGACCCDGVMAGGSRRRHLYDRGRIRSSINGGIRQAPRAVASLRCARAQPLPSSTRAVYPAALGTQACNRKNQSRHGRYDQVRA